MVMMGKRRMMKRWKIHVLEFFKGRGGALLPRVTCCSRRRQKSRKDFGMMRSHCKLSGAQRYASRSGGGG
jgi:hypothetical protein